MSKPGDIPQVRVLGDMGSHQAMAVQLPYFLNIFGFTTILQLKEIFHSTYLKKLSGE